MWGDAGERKERALGQADSSVRDVTADTADPVSAKGQEALQHMTMVDPLEGDEYVAAKIARCLRPCNPPSLRRG